MERQYNLYTSIKKRMDERRFGHEKELRLIEIRKAEFKKTMELVGTVVFAWVFFMVLLFAGIWVYRQP